MLKELFYIPNLLSILRLVLLLPASFLMLYHFEDQHTLIIILMVIMYITDLLDGFLARKFNQVSELGKIIDPIADKVSVVVFTAILYYKDMIPGWFLVVVLLRDILILSFGYYVSKTKKITLMSNFPGKAAVLGIGLILLLTVINFSFFFIFISYFYYIVLFLILYSACLYYIRFKKTIGDNLNAT